MTFVAFEQSNHDARPVSFYRFQWGETEWRYCNADRVMSLDGDDYTPVAVSEESSKQGGREIPEFRIEVPLSLPVVAKFRGTPPATRVTLTVRTLHPDDPDLQAKYRWTGAVSSVSPVDGARARIVSRPTARRGGLRFTYGRGCKYALFGPGCEVVKALHATARTVTAIDGNVMTLDGGAPSEGRWNGGFIEWDADGLGTIERRGIERETAPGVFLLFGRGDGITVGLAVTVYPHCAHTADDCDEEFDNLPNYPGLDFMRGESPFDGRALL